MLPGHRSFIILSPEKNNHVENEICYNDIKGVNIQQRLIATSTDYSLVVLQLEKENIIK